jgi:DNA-binding GntR family transcriptional regulator
MIRFCLARLWREGLLDRTAAGYVVTGAAHQQEPPAPGVTRSLVREELRGELLAGHYPPGAPLSRAALARRWQCHPCTVSRALADLAALGLVTRPTGRGYLAATPTPARIPAPRRSPENPPRDQRPVLAAIAAS